MDRNQVKNSSSNQQQQQPTQLRKYKLFIGSLHPSIQFDEVVKLFIDKGYEVELDKRKSRINKRFCILKLTSLLQYETLLQEENRVHHIRSHKIEVEVYLKGNLKHTRINKTLKKKVYIGNLPAWTTDRELKSFFSQFGPVKAAYVKNRSSRNKFKFGFVEFFNEKNAKIVINMKSLIFKNNEIFVKQFKSSRPDQKDQERQSHGIKSNERKGRSETTREFTRNPQPKFFPSEMVKFIETIRDDSPLRALLLKKIHLRHIVDDELLIFKKKPTRNLRYLYLF